MNTNELEEGTWLVVVDGNSTSYKQIKPDFLEVEAALSYLQEKMVKEMHKICEMRPKTTIMSKKEQKAWAKYKEIMGKDMPKYFEFPSLYEISQKGCEFLKENIVKKKTHKKSKTYKTLEEEKKRIINPILQLDFKD